MDNSGALGGLAELGVRGRILRTQEWRATEFEWVDCVAEFG